MVKESRLLELGEFVTFGVYSGEPEHKLKGFKQV